ncbi:MAG: hypothetical protein NTW86_00575 [Candidatus Sumerlaeota bacterium]|nr:hypothetical protein [Candidatus Sumerlaeota bacterium]
MSWTGISSATLGVLLAGAAYAADQANVAKPASYTPQFTAVKTEFGHYWIEDHGQRIALFGATQNDTGGYNIGLFRQFPGQVLDETRITDSEILDFVSLPGLRLNTNWISAPAMRGVPGEIKLDSSDPAQLIIRLTWKKSAEEFGTQVIGVTYDPDLARYVIRVEDNLQVNQPGGGEYCNFYANGLGDFRPDVGRYDRLLFQDADDGGQLKAHYLSGLVRSPVPLIHLPAANALVGYANEKDGNPVVIIEQSTPRSHDGICPCWYDSHLRWDEAYEPGPKKSQVIKPGVPGPPYCYYAKFKAFWNSPAETSALLARAQTVSLAPFAEKFRSALPIDMNVVNDFERYADFLTGKVKHIYFPLNQRSITQDTTVGHSGHSSICFVSKTDKGARQSLTGPELMVTPGRQVKISAWVKTANVTGEGFYLESGFGRWTPSGNEQFGPLYQSAKLSGDHDWTLLEIPMPVTPPKAEFLIGKRIDFRLSGQGTAWVDDFVFAEQDAGGPPV